MRIFLGVPTLSPARAKSCVEIAVASATGPIYVIPYYNGVTPSAEEDISDVYSTIVSGQNVGVPRALHSIYRAATRTWEAGDQGPVFPAGPDDILLFIHDDVSISEGGWDTRLKDLFQEHSACGLAGFGGACGLGDPDLYKKPYELIQLARRNFISNMLHAEAHGKRVTLAYWVATIDGFAMACRIKFLQQIDGFNWVPSWMVHHNYDNALACMAKRHGWMVAMLPISCHHHGGLTATKSDYLDGLATKHGGDGEIHRRGHEWLYNEFRDVLPILATVAP